MVLITKIRVLRHSYELESKLPNRSFMSDFIGEYYRGYEGGEFRLWFI